MAGDTPIAGSRAAASRGARQDVSLGGRGALSGGPGVRPAGAVWRGTVVRSLRVTEARALLGLRGAVSV